MSTSRRHGHPRPGTWDLKPGITILGMGDRTSWGLQGMATVRLGENSRGYKVGNATEGTAWFAVKAADRVLTVGWQKSFAPIGHD